MKFFLMVLVLSVALCDCTMPKKLSSSLINDSTWRMSDGDAIPIGTIVPDGDPRSAERSGLYPTPRSDIAMCCWLAPVATVFAAKTSVAGRLTVRIFVPNFTFFRSGQALTISVGGVRLATQSLPSGVHVLTLALPAQLRAYIGRVPIEIRSTRSFVPANEGVNSDPRSLGVVLVGITFS